MNQATTPSSTELITSSLILSLTLSFTFIVSSCEDSSSDDRVSEAASQCVDIDLMNQCPVGTLPLLETDAETSCSEAGSVDLNGALSSHDSSQEVDRVCAGSGSCRIVCELQTH